MNRLNLACLAVGSTHGMTVFPSAYAPPQSSLFGCRFDESAELFEAAALIHPPQSSLFGCRFDGKLEWDEYGDIFRLNLACLAVGSTYF